MGMVWNKDKRVILLDDWNWQLPWEAFIPFKYQEVRMQNFLGIHPNGMVWDKDK